MKVRILKITTLAAAWCLAFGALPAFSQDAARLRLSGLEKLSSKASEVVDVNLDGAMLKLASKFVNNNEDGDDAEVAEMIQKLKGIYVKSFEFEKEGEYTDADVEAIRAQLRSPGWSKIINVRSKHDGDNAEIYLMGTESNVQGLAILAADPKELTVVNLVGPIDIDKLSHLSGHMGVPNLTIERGNGAQSKEKSGDKKP